jgi:hypothetical protein
VAVAPEGGAVEIRSAFRTYITALPVRMQSACKVPRVAAILPRERRSLTNIEGFALVRKIGNHLRVYKAQEVKASLHCMVHTNTTQ